MRDRRPSRLNEEHLVPSAVTELLGLPGAGKSALERTVAAWGTVRTVRDWRGDGRSRLLPPTVELLLRAPVLSMATYLAVATRRGSTGVHLRRARSVQRRHIMIKALDGRAVVDEGAVHALFVTLYGTRETAVSRVLLRLVLTLLSRHVGRYLYLDTPLDQCIDNFRRAGRTSMRFHADSPEHVVEEFRRDQTYPQILDGLRRVAGAKLVVVADPAAASAELTPQADGDDRVSSATDGGVARRPSR